MPAAITHGLRHGRAFDYVCCRDMHTPPRYDVALMARYEETLCRRAYGAMLIAAACLRC